MSVVGVAEDRDLEQRVTALEARMDVAAADAAAARHLAAAQIVDLLTGLIDDGKG